MKPLSRAALTALLQPLTLAADDTRVVSLLQDFVQKEDKIILSLQLPYPLMPWAQHDLQRQIAALLPDYTVELSFTLKVAAHVAQAGIAPIPGIKNIVGVASGKGGVGKSTTAVNLALALASGGAAVGILDADIYGPNQPHLLGICEKPALNDARKLIPVRRYGLQSMSMGYLVEAETPMVWRGPMISTALLQMLQDTAWEALDYLIIDLPPGTGDIQLTLAKKVPMVGAVMVTTPQELALLDVHKAVAMFQKTDVPVLGVIENMAMHVCTQCGHAEAIFGEGGAERLAQAHQVPLLGSVPLDRRVRMAADAGQPIVVAEPNAELTQRYQQLAMQIAARVAACKPSYAHLFKKIVVEKSD